MSLLDVRMGPTLLCELGLFLLCTLLCTGHAQDAVLTIEPNCSSFFIGEFVTFMCDMNKGADTDWEYKLNKDGREFVPYNTHKDYRLEITSTGYSGDYQCSGRRKISHYTKSSKTVSVTVSGKPRATLTAGTTIIPVGGSVTLTCSVGRSAEWKYEWFRRTQRITEVQIRRDDQPNRVIRVSQGGIYRCRGRRGNPVYITDISDEVTIIITFSNKVAVKQQQQHNWPQIFSGETITLTCEVQEGGEPTEWEYQWRGPRQTTQWKHNNYLTFSISESSSGDYMCKSRRRDDSYSSTEWSEAFTLSASTDQPKAEITDMRDNPVGGSVILSCSVNHSSGWKYYWYRHENSSEPLSTEDAVFPSDGQIRVSQEGLYRCRGGRGDPVYYTEDSDPISVDKNKLSEPEKPSFLTLLIAGVVCGVLLILLLLLLLFCFKKSKDSGFISRTQSTNQSSSTNHMINQDEAQHSQHTSPPEDDSLLYAQVFHNKAKAKRDNDDSLLYAQVSYNKAKAKRDKEKSAPAAAEETVYSEVRTQTMPAPL